MTKSHRPNPQTQLLVLGLLFSVFLTLTATAAPQGFDFTVRTWRVLIAIGFVGCVLLSSGIARIIWIGDAGTDEKMEFRGRTVTALGVVSCVLMGIVLLLVPQPWPYGQGVLTAADDSVTPICPSRTYTLATVDAGTNEIEVRAFPFTFLYLSGRAMLVLDQRDNRLVVKTLELLDDRQNEIAVIASDKFSIPTGTRFERPDAHTLVVYDHAGIKALQLRYNAANHISVEGIFKNNGRTVEITKDHVRLARATFTHNCWAEAIYYGDDFVGLRPGPGDKIPGPQPVWVEFKGVGSDHDNLH